jgi:tRNA-uridine 2-sulfurtransferase
LGEHKGTHNFTIGQRRGLRVSSNEVIYVTSIDPELRVVYAGPKEALLRNELTAGAANWIMEDPPTEPFEALAKIRYNSEAVPATIIPLPEGQIRVIFKESQPAITPGQVLAVYDLTDTFIMGGGWIN